MLILNQKQAKKNEIQTYSSLKPFTCNILICLTIVLLPDSPAPKQKKVRKQKEMAND